MADEDGDEELPEEERLVEHERRRWTLRTLLAFDEPVTLPDLAEEVAIREVDRPITDIPGDRVKEIYLSLYHTHVPKLADAGLVEYEQEADLVALADDPRLEILDLEG